MTVTTREFFIGGLFGLLLMTVGVAGCSLLPDKAMSGPADQVIYQSFGAPPRIRYGTYASPILGTPFLGEDLGVHGYYWPFFEGNGIAYTCHGGHIDIIHLRIAADWTAYLAAESYRHLVRNSSHFAYKLAVDRSIHHVYISYPQSWDYLPSGQRTAIAREMAMAMGPYLAFQLVTWHEILTWYGFKCIGLPVEYSSAFSWEDSYSNVLGTIIGARALCDTKHSYNEAVKLLLDEEMSKLGIQTAATAKRAGLSVKGEWFTGDIALFVDMKKRNFDIGLDDGYITPTLVPDVSVCPDAHPVSYPVPTLDVLTAYGFSITVEIEPREWEKNKVLSIVQETRRINPQIHFPEIMHQIRLEAAAKYGPEYDPDDDSRQHYLTQAD
jgi:hypothetical protein